MKWEYFYGYVEIHKNIKWRNGEIHVKSGEASVDKKNKWESFELVWSYSNESDLCNGEKEWVALSWENEKK